MISVTGMSAMLSTDVFGSSDRLLFIDKDSLARTLSFSDRLEDTVSGVANFFGGDSNG